MNSTLLPNSSFKKTGITLDVLLILILVPAHIIGRDAYLSVVALLAYLLLSLWYPLSSDMVNTVNNKRAQVTFLIRFGIIIIIAFGAVIVPTLSNIINRSLTPIEADGFSAANVTLSDSAM